MTTLEAATRLQAEVEAGRMLRGTAEQLLGFMIMERLSWGIEGEAPAPTYYRKCARLLALGLADDSGPSGRHPLDLSA